jgi:serine/threonine protein kinase
VTEDDILSSVSDAVMAGRAVDWDSCEAACTPNTRALVRELRAVAGIAQTHRAAAGPAGQSFSERKRVVSARERWGSLELIAIVGRGASGLVYRAWDTRLDREVALKLLHTDNSSTASPVVAEGRLLARVRHPNVIAVYGADHIDGRTGVWMEFVNGRTLEEIVRDEGPQDIAEVLEVGTALCRGLHAVHEAGLLHRDVTTRNVMRDPSGRIVLMDLHTGQETGGHGHPELVGTPLFLAPEVLIGGQTASVRSDVYSAGVVLYRLLTGAYPVEGSTLEQLREAWIEGEVGPVRSRRADLPAGLATAVEQALRRDPVHRTTSAAVLAGQLEALSSPREDAGRGISKPFIALASSLLLCGGALVHLARDVTPPPSSTTLRISGSGVSAERSTRPLNMEELQWGDFIATAPPSSDGRLIPGLRQGLRPAVRDLLTGGVQLLEPDHGTDSGAGPDQVLSSVLPRWPTELHASCGPRARSRTSALQPGCRRTRSSSHIWATPAGMESWPRSIFRVARSALSRPSGASPPECPLLPTVPVSPSTFPCLPT